METGGHLRVEMDGHVAIVTFNRSPHNYVTVKLLTELADELEKLDAIDRVRCILLQSGGKNFCAGAQLGGDDTDNVIGVDKVRPLYAQAVRLFAVKKPIVAAIQGAAVGAGLGLALVADFRIASLDARFSVNFVALGFHPGFGLTYTLPRLIGPPRSDLMFMTGRRIQAAEARSWGLINDAVPREELESAALDLAREIATNGPVAVVATRRTLRADLAEAVHRQTEIELQEQMLLWTTLDFEEGVKSMTERRSPNFVGR